MTFKLFQAMVMVGLISAVALTGCAGTDLKEEDHCLKVAMRDADAPFDASFEECLAKKGPGYKWHLDNDNDDKNDGGGRDTGDGGRDTGGGGEVGSTGGGDTGGSGDTGDGDNGDGDNGDDGNNGHGNDDDGYDPSNPGKSNGNNKGGNNKP